MVKEQNRITLADQSIVTFTVYDRIDEGYGLEIKVDDIVIKNDSFGHTVNSAENAVKWKNFIFTKLAKEIHFLSADESASPEELIGEDIMNLWCYYDEDVNRVLGSYQEILNLIGGK